MGTMPKFIVPLLITASAAALLSGCSGHGLQSTVVSEDCSKAIEQQANAWADTDTSEADLRKAQAKPLTACAGLDEWATAVMNLPSSMGFDELDLEQAAQNAYQVCEGGKELKATAVCSDAKKRGYLDEDN